MAAKKWKEDVEYVHQLRVSTRRAGAAIDVFQHTLPRKRAAKLRKLIRDLLAIKRRLDPEGLFTSDLARRVGIDPVLNKPLPD